MNVLTSNIEFKSTLSERKDTKRIVVHHSASGASTTVEEIHRWHIAKGWSGIGYHYIVYADGTVYRGRPEWARGAHAYQDPKHEANSDGIGICLIGDFTSSVPNNNQLGALVELIQDIWTRYKNIPVIGHRDVQPTACPGASFPWGELMKRLEGEQVSEDWKLNIIRDAMAAGFITQYHKPDDPAPKWFILAVMLNFKKQLEEAK